MLRTKGACHLFFPVINVPGGSGSVYLHVVPEPNTLVMLVGGLLALLLFARRRRKR